MATESKTHLEYKRFNLFHRIIHILVFISFTVLVFTGMPLKYKETHWARWAMDAMGGVTAAGVYHRLAALLTIITWACEVAFMGYLIIRARGKNIFTPDSIMFGRKDGQDFKGMFRWFVGKGEKPQFARFTYWEKFDFASLVAGTVIIGGTGLMMWFPMTFTKILPGIFLNFAFVIHSNEALLAAGVIFIFVHLFSAHLRPESFPIDKVIFTGSLPLEHYKEERPMEYERRVQAGTLDEVLVVKHVTWRTKFGNVVWYTITVLAGLAAVLFALFIGWAIFG